MRTPARMSAETIRRSTTLPIDPAQHAAVIDAVQATWGHGFAETCGDGPDGSGYTYAVVSPVGQRNIGEQETAAALDAVPVFQLGAWLAAVIWTESTGARSLVYLGSEYNGGRFWDALQEECDRLQAQAALSTHAIHYVDGDPSCLTCGATFERGSTQVSECTGRTDLVHGDPRESGHLLDCFQCSADPVDPIWHYCERVAQVHDCECILCRYC